MSSAVNIPSLVDHFFRHESGRLMAVLTRVFGLHNLELVEDVVQSALLQALESWKFQGVPADPAAWVYRVARNKALDVIRHQAVADKSAPEWLSLHRTTDAIPLDRLFLSSEIADSQLRMMFVCCHPDLPKESQIALTLKTLCGFGVEEIARALLTTDTNVKKRITRAKRKFLEQPIEFEVPAGEALTSRLDSVHTVIYLLFNEGYSSSHPHELIRRDLCAEAIRLGLLLHDHPACRNEDTSALLALMLFHAARFDARLDPEGGILLLQEQDRTKWDPELIARGTYFLSESAAGEQITRYQLEAAIAAQHSLAPSFDSTDWQTLLMLYDHLIQMYPSPIYELNRAIVIAMTSGPDAAIDAINAIKELDTLQDYHLLHATLGEFHLQAGRLEKAQACFARAIECTSSHSEKRLLEKKLSDARRFARREN